MVRQRRDIPVVGEYDVVVCGGGPSGMIAAIAAARGGARTAIVERYGFFGGMATAALVAPISVFNYNGRRIIDGIPWEFISRLIEIGGAREEKPLGNITFSPEKYKLMAQRMLTEAGVEIYLHSYLSACITEQGGIIGEEKRSGGAMEQGGIIGRAEVWKGGGGRLEDGALERAGVGVRGSACIAEGGGVIEKVEAGDSGAMEQGDGIEEGSGLPGGESVKEGISLPGGESVEEGSGLLKAKPGEGGTTITHIIIENKNGGEAIAGRYFIDATGDGDLGRMAGVPMQPKSEYMQPASLIFMLGGVDTDSLPMIRHAKQGVNYHDLAIREILERLRESDPSIPLFGGPWYCGVLERGVVLVNMTRSYADMADNREQTRTELQMREEVHLFSRLLKENVPAFKDSFLIQTATQTGIRETRRIKGAYTLTGEDYINAVDFPDAISRGCHPVDIHSASTTGQRCEFLKDAAFVPYRCLYAEGFPNYLVCGRAFSADPVASASVRVQASCMGLGQAAGAAAALCLQGSEQVISDGTEVAALCLRGDEQGITDGTVAAALCLRGSEQVISDGTGAAQPCLQGRGQGEARPIPVWAVDTAKLREILISYGTNLSK